MHRQKPAGALEACSAECALRPTRDRHEPGIWDSRFRPGGPERPGEQTRSKGVVRPTATWGFEYARTDYTVHHTQEAISSSPDMNEGTGTDRCLHHE